VTVDALFVADVEYEYEEAVQECGYGKFHYLLLLVCGWANASDAIEVRQATKYTVVTARILKLN